jgi:hypothetical protein
VPLRNRRSGVRRTIVPETVGKRRRDGFRLPSAWRSSGPARPSRGLPSAKSRSLASAYGDEGRLRLGDPPVRVRGEARGARVPDELRTVGNRHLEPEVRDHDQLLHLRREGGEAALQLVHRLVDDDDAGDAHSRLR